MVMALADLRAIYELLFQDGVIVAKKDRRPQAVHPELNGVTNLKVMRAMASLKSRGYVRETFAWKHAYYYITDEGVAHVRSYLRLPPEIMPATFQRARRPAVAPTAKGHKSHNAPPKPGSEGREAVVESSHKGGGEERGPSARSPKTFRGSNHGSSVSLPAVQDFYKREESEAKQGNWEGSASLPAVYIPCTTKVRRTLCPRNSFHLIFWSELLLLV